MEREYYNNLFLYRFLLILQPLDFFLNNFINIFFLWVSEISSIVLFFKNSYYISKKKDQK